MKAKARRSPRDEWHIVEVLDTRIKDYGASGEVTYIKCFIKGEEWWLGPGLYYLINERKSNEPTPPIKQ